MVTCASCGSLNPDEASFCNKCGAPLKTASPVQAAEPQPQPYQAPYTQVPPAYGTYVQRPAKDRSIAMVLEILPGLFGFLGFGWIYSGNTASGIGWLVGFLIWTVVATVISVFTGGIGVLCWLPVSIVCIVISAMNLSKYTKAHPETFGV